MSTCGTCTGAQPTSNTIVSKPSCGIPSNYKEFTTPQFDTCEVASPTNLPPGVCEGFDCIEKMPACAVQNGHILAMTKLSNYIDLDKLVSFDPRNFLEIPKNWDILKKIKCVPVYSIQSGVGTNAVLMANGSYQIDMAFPFGQGKMKTDTFPNSSANQFFYSITPEDYTQVEVYIEGVRQFTGFTASATNIVLATAVSAKTVQLTYQTQVPVITPVVDNKVSVDNMDSTPGFLINKIVAGSGIDMSVMGTTNKFLEIKTTVALPVPTTLDFGKTFTVNSAGNIVLADNCGCGFKIIDNTTAMNQSDVFDALQFMSTTLDVTLGTLTAGVQPISINLKPLAKLFTLTDTTPTTNDVVVGENLKLWSPLDTVSVVVGTDEVRFEIKKLLPTLLNGTWSDYVYTTGSATPTIQTIQAFSQTTHKYTNTDKNISIDLSQSGTDITHNINLTVLPYGGMQGNSTSQTIPAGVWTQVSMPDIYASNTSTIHTTANSLTAQATMLHHISGQTRLVSFGALAGGNQTSELQVRVNGTVVIEQATSFVLGQADGGAFSFAKSMSLNTGDVVTVWVRSTNTALVDNLPHRTFTHINPIR